jgi:hypothetical protein
MPPKRRPKRNLPRNKRSVVSRQIDALSTAVALPVHRFRRVYQEIISGAAGGIVSYTPQIRIGILPSVSDFSNLYSEYRVTRVTALFRPLQGTFSLIGPAVFPTVNSVFDYTSGAALSGLSAAFQYPSWKQNAFSQQRPVIQLSWTPRVVVNDLLTIGTAGVALLPSGTFLSINSLDTLYFGLRTVIEEFPSAMQIQVTLLLDLEFKGVR